MSCTLWRPAPQFINLAYQPDYPKDIKNSDEEEEEALVRLKRLEDMGRPGLLGRLAAIWRSFSVTTV